MKLFLFIMASLAACGFSAGARADTAGARDREIEQYLKDFQSNPSAAMQRSPQKWGAKRPKPDTDPHAHMDHEKTTPVIAKHDFADGDDVPGSFFAMGPGIKHDLRLMGLGASVYDVAPTLLHIYGIEQPKQMRGRILTEIFENADNKVAAKQ